MPAPRSRGPVGPQVLQLALKPFGATVGDGHGGNFRPDVCVVVHRDSRFCLALEIGKPDERPFALAARTMTKALERGAFAPPVRVELRDPELATALAKGVDPSKLSFVTVKDLAVADTVLAELSAELLPAEHPRLLDAPGITVERVAAFADAAALFHAARPWRHLHDDDLLDVASPKPPAGLRFASVLGAGGAVLGLAFHASLKAFQRMASDLSPSEKLGSGKRWSLMFNLPDEVPLSDTDLWSQHGLRLAPDDTLPLLLCYLPRSGVTRPDAKTLAYVEGLCRALAATTEADIDSGRWEKTVTTFDGPAVYKLSIPHLLEPPPDLTPARTGLGAKDQMLRQIQRMIAESGAQTPAQINAFLKANVNGRVLPPPPTDTPAEKALALCDLATSQPSRREYQLLRQALALDPDCAEAHMRLAHRCADPVDAEAHYRHAVDAAKRTLGPRPFSDPKYPFWDAVESRPYLRALAGLADALERQDRLAEAVVLLSELLRLNPNDNQGVRYILTTLLIAQERLNEARTLIEDYERKGEISAFWPFAAALIAHLEHRDEDADRHLRHAVKQNPHVLPVLCNPDGPDLPPPGAWSPGTPSEALMILDFLAPLYDDTPSALPWLRATLRSIPRPTPSPSAKPSPGRKPRNKRR